MATPTIPALPPEVYAAFSGLIDQNAVQRIFTGFSTASANNVQHVHLLFQSTGGVVGDGVCLYNFFKSLTVDLTLYNSGSVASIAAIAYLGAKRRKVSAYATFMVHRTQTTTQFATTQKMKSLAETAVIEDRRTEAIIRDNITLPDEKWSYLDHNDLIFTAEEAVKVGIAQEIGEFTPPPGTRLFTL